MGDLSVSQSCLYKPTTKKPYLATHKIGPTFPGEGIIIVRDYKHLCQNRTLESKSAASHNLETPFKENLMSPSLLSVIFQAVAQIAPIVIKAIEDAVAQHQASKAPAVAPSESEVSK